MIFVLDTNTCIYFLNGSYRSVADELSSHPAEELAVTSITVAELFYGAHHSARKTRNLLLLEDFFLDLQILTFDRPAAENFGPLKEILHQQGKLLGPYDLLIASIVRSRGFTLVTHDTKSFSQISDILLVDWVR
ncbi:MAG TPA: type II toxin-antitoxin system VapC family toxin [Acidobacteriota bacterium]|jgi:tRNA(fMet)-specific endonuclease VapC|nr:type II toxin-antitoxin system VapC family toxin [Acidobacteriota bacterium]